MVCPRCKNTIKDGVNTCPVCGLSAKVTGSEIKALPGLKKLMSSPMLYLCALLLSLSVVFEIINILSDGKGNFDILSEFGLSTVFKPVTDLFSDAGILVSILSVIPSALFCIGLWLIPIAVNEDSGANRKSCFLLLKTSTVIRLIFYGAAGSVVTMLFGASVVGTASYAETYVIIALSIFMLFCAALTLFTVYYFLSVMRFIRCVEFSVIKGRNIRIGVKYIAVFNAVTSIIHIIGAFMSSPALFAANIAAGIFLIFISVFIKKISRELNPKIKRTTEKKEEKILTKPQKPKSEPKPYIPKDPEQISFAIPNKSKKYCVKCGEMIGEDVSTCPFCHSDQEYAGQQHFKI